MTTATLNPGADSVRAADLAEDTAGEEEEFETLLAQVLAAEAAAYRRPGIERQPKPSKHSYRFIWRGTVVGQRSHTKAYRTADERRRARKAQRAVRKASR